MGLDPVVLMVGDFSSTRPKFCKQGKSARELTLSIACRGASVWLMHLASFAQDDPAIGGWWFRDDEQRTSGNEQRQTEPNGDE